MGQRLKKLGSYDLLYQKRVFEWFAQREVTKDGFIHNFIMNFEWDDVKAIANLKKHGVSFEEAKTVFDNPLAVIFDDEAHSFRKEREDYEQHSR